MEDALGTVECEMVLSCFINCNHSHSQGIQEDGSGTD